MSDPPPLNTPNFSRKREVPPSTQSLQLDSGSAKQQMEQKRLAAMQKRKAAKERRHIGVHEGQVVEAQQAQLQREEGERK